MSFRNALASTASMLAVALTASADLMPPKVRTPQFPLKTARMLLSDGDIAIARENMAQYATAKAIADTIIKRADAWVAWEDDALRALVPTADVPRAFNVGTAGCPQCGQEIYAKAGTYPWIIDPRKPFQVECPVDGSTYPSNDFAAYYASGMNDTALLAGEHPDDGWGWIGPDGHRYWFVAYANHWTWRNHIIPAVHYLGRAYILTGDGDYARKAAILLDRIAEVYPNMDYHVQSRYGQLQAANGARYQGKIVNHIWETRVLAMLAEAYDFVWDGIGDDTVAGKTGEQVRANIEANLLEEGIDSYFSGKVRGNFGMHQKALVYAGLARQHGNQEEWFDGLLNEANAIYSMTGLNYALYNLVYRDGPPYETSPGYNLSWVVNITTVAEALQRAGYDAYGIQKLRRLYDGVLDIVNVGKHTPALGDSGSVHGGLVGNDPLTFQRAWRAYGDPRYRAHLQSFNATGEAGIRNFESLFKPVVEPVEAAAYKPPSRLMDGYGMAILNNASDTVSLALYYGYRGGHGHYDRLSFELYAHGRPMMPDLGYPDFMNAYVPGIYTWSKITIAHNTVTVDARRQPNNRPGTVNLFADGGFARALDIDAAATYGQTEEYRRRAVMVDMDDTHAYVVDAFTVRGGTQHDYSLHGPPGTFTPAGGQWSEPAPGTLAGPEVPLGYIYDDPAIAGEDYTGSYANYGGSGFQHLVDVQHLEDGAAQGDWAHAQDANARLRINLLDGPEAFIQARAQISPVKHKEMITYLIARNSGADLDSQFLSVIEPYSDAPWIQSSRGIALGEGDGSAVEIIWHDPAGHAIRDYVLLNDSAGVLRLSEGDMHTDATMAILRRREGTPDRHWLVGGTYLSVDGEKTPQHPAIRGTVTGVDPENGTVHVACDPATVAGVELGGMIVHFENDFRRAAHPIQSVAAAEGGITITVDDDLRVGRVRIAEVREGGLATATGLAFAPVYDGTYAADTAFSELVPVRQVAGGVVEFVAPRVAPAPFETGGDAWLVNVGPGDRIEIPRVTVR